VKRTRLSLDGGEPTDGTTQDATAGQDAPAANAPAATTEPAGPAPLKTVVCQRCRVECKPDPARRGFVRCPTCGWRHKPLTEIKAMAARRRAAIAAVGRSAR